MGARCLKQECGPSVERCELDGVDLGHLKDRDPDANRQEREYQGDDLGGWCSEAFEENLNGEHEAFCKRGT